MSNAKEVVFRLATKADSYLDTYDNTKLTAYATCPTWGVLRYQMHKTMSARREMALECGEVMHQAFSFVRLCQLYHDYKTIEGRDLEVGKELFKYHFRRLFKDDRIEEIVTDICLDNPNLIDEDINLYCIRGAVAVLNTSGYYDDPDDKKRTLSNMEEAIIHYVNCWNWRLPIWVRDVTDPKSDVGIEIAFDVVVEWRYANADVKMRRFTGKIDGIRVYEKGITLEENKTASRLNEAWAQSFDLNSQPTGYMIATSVFTQETVRRAKIMGICIPLPRTRDFGGTLEPVVTREDHNIADWLKWFDAIATGYERNHDNPFDALRFTHSCGRYFRPCSMIPFCNSPRQDQEEMVEEMATDEWSPLVEDGSAE